MIISLATPRLRKESLYCNVLFINIRPFSVRLAGWSSRLYLRQPLAPLVPRELHAPDEPLRGRGRQPSGAPTCA